HNMAPFSLLGARDSAPVGRGLAPAARPDIPLVFPCKIQYNIICKKMLDFDAASRAMLEAKEGKRHGIYRTNPGGAVGGNAAHPAVVRPHRPAETRPGGGERIPLLWPRPGRPAPGHPVLPG